MLLDEMKGHRFFTEIAFIPWNYRRSDLKTVRLFSENPDYYAICVHGCNHLGNEFGRDDYQDLSRYPQPPCGVWSSTRNLPDYRMIPLSFSRRSILFRGDAGA